MTNVDKSVLSLLKMKRTPIHESLQVNLSNWINSSLEFLVRNEGNLIELYFM